MQRALLALSLIATLPACTHQAPHASPIARGEAVTELDQAIWVVFQGRDNTHWFGSNGQGVYRSDGKTLVRFTTEHGLGGNHIRAIQEDRSGNFYVSSDPGAISRFDGRGFSPLSVAEPSKSEWKLDPGGIDFVRAITPGALTHPAVVVATIRVLTEALTKDGLPPHCLFREPAPPCRRTSL